MKVVSIFLLGVGILVGAIILNFLASRLGLMSWYEFFQNAGKTDTASYIWLFVGYPLGLGFIAYWASKVLSF